MFCRDKQELSYSYIGFGKRSFSCLCSLFSFDFLSPPSLLSGFFLLLSCCPGAIHLSLILLLLLCAMRAQQQRKRGRSRNNLPGTFHSSTIFFLLFSLYPSPPSPPPFVRVCRAGGSPSLPYTKLRKSEFSSFGLTARLFLSFFLFQCATQREASPPLNSTFTNNTCRWHPPPGAVGKVPLSLPHQQHSMAQQSSTMVDFPSTQKHRCRCCKD